MIMLRFLSPSDEQPMSSASNHTARVTKIREKEREQTEEGQMGEEEEGR